jgi:nucleoside-diphosphate-sugar epimerase
MTNRSVSLTGATGFLGWHIATAFMRAGWHVRAIVRPGNTKPLPDGPGRIDARESALHAAALAPAIAGTDVLVHAAALVRAGHEDILRAVNVDGTRAVIDAANDTGTRLVFISSQAAHGPGTRRDPAREDDASHPLTAYGRSKLAAERHIRADARVPWTILRPSAIYGPRDRGFLQLFRLASRGRYLLVAPPDTAFTLIHADDAARAVAMAADHPGAVGETFFIGHPEPQTAGDILRQLARIYDRPYTPRRVPAFALRALAAAGDVAWRLGIEPLFDSSRLAELHAGGFVCAVDRASQRIGFTAATPLPDGLASTARWYRREGWV